MPIGHYTLGALDMFGEPIDSEGFGQIPINDFSTADCAALDAAGDGTFTGMTATIGGIEAPIGQLAQYGRSALMIHGGGSNAPYPLLPEQELCRAFGCSRLQNAGLMVLSTWLAPLMSGNIVVYTALETPA
jgi:hypothetical protein